MAQQPAQSILVTIINATPEGSDAGNYALSLENSPTTGADIT